MSHGSACQKLFLHSDVPWQAKKHVHDLILLPSSCTNWTKPHIAYQNSRTMSTLSPSSQRATTHQLATKELFDSFTQREKLYAHHLARAARHGSRIILRQTSPEGTSIFDFILELHKACEGRPMWRQTRRARHLPGVFGTVLIYYGQLLRK